jgi:phosphoglycerate dehydrogenase-like enzyme
MDGQDVSRRVLVLSSFSPARLAQLEALAPTLHVEQRDMFTPVTAISDDVWATVEVLLTFLTFPQRAQAPRLRWIQLNSAGVDHALAQPIGRDPAITLTNLSGIHAVPIAEHVFTLLLTWRHQMPRFQAWQAQQFWPRQAEVREALAGVDELAGLTLGVVGYGSIGRHVARVGRAFGMRVLALQRSTDRRDHGYVEPGTGDPDGTLPERYYGPDELHALLAASDVVVLALPDTPATRGVVDERAFQAMRPSTFLVNVGRGTAIDEDALLRALQTGRIAGAALDVVQQEPLPADHPLWRAPNLLLTPHISGITPRYEDRAAALFAANLGRYVAGEQLLNVYDRSRGY